MGYSIPKRWRMFRNREDEILALSSFRFRLRDQSVMLGELIDSNNKAVKELIAARKELASARTDLTKATEQLKIANQGRRNSLGTTRT